MATPGEECPTLQSLQAGQLSRGREIGITCQIPSEARPCRIPRARHAVKGLHNHAHPPQFHET